MAITERELFSGHRLPYPEPRVEARLIEDHAYRVVIEERIRELWGRRAWYARHNGWIVEQRVEDMAELRILLRLARHARRTARPVVERLDPVTVARGQYPDPARVGYHDWQAGAAR